MKKNRAFLLVLLASSLVLGVIACEDEKKECALTGEEHDTTGCPPVNCMDAGTGSGIGTSTAAPSNDLGEVCAYNDDCAEYCMIGIDRMHPYCTRSCENTPCPRGYACLSSGQIGMACVIGPCTGNADCPDLYSCNMEDTENQFCQHLTIGCQSNLDCPAAVACIQGECKLLCDNDDHCQAGYHCLSWPNRRCVECANNSHCEGGFSCENGNCNTNCIENDDCRPGYSCQGAACQLIQGGGPGTAGDPDAGCEEDSECQFFCYRDRCTQTCSDTDTASCPEGMSCHSHHLICEL